jgi:hypothetical protein
MNKTKENLLQKYLSEDMSIEEIKDFEASLLIDNELADHLKLHKEINEFLQRYVEKENFLKVLNEVHQEYISKKK